MLTETRRALRRSLNTPIILPQVILPLIEHALKCSPFNEEPSDEEEPSDAAFGVELMPQVSGIEPQDADGKNANVCAFTGTMFLSLALGKLLKLYQVRSRPHMCCLAHICNCYHPHIPHPN